MSGAATTSQQARTRSARPPTETPMRVEILDAQAGLAALAQDWTSLIAASERAPWSSLPGVLDAWRAMQRKGRDARIVAVQDDDGLCGLLPIMRDRAWRGPSCAPRYDYDPQDRWVSASRRPRPIPVRQITTAASVPATMLWVGPLCRPGAEDAVFDAVAGCLLGLDGWDALVLPSWQDDEARWLRSFARRGATARAQRLGRVVQNLSALRPFEAIVADQGGKCRQNIRRARAAAAAAGLRFEVAAGAEAVAPLFPDVERIARASWKHEGRAGQHVRLPYDGPQRAFFEALLSDPRLGATPVIATASGPDGPVATLIGLEHARTVTALLVFMDGRCRTASPGQLLVGALMDWGFARGARRFDFNATHDWVRHFVDERREVSNVLVFAPTLAGRTLGWISAAAEGLRR